MDYDTGASSTGMGSTGMGKYESKRQGSLISGGTSRNEDPLTSTIEKTTARVPSSAFLALALGAIAGSLATFLMGKKHAALLVATWVPTILILGNYNKIVKALENLEEGHLPHGASNAF